MYAPFKYSVNCKEFHGVSENLVLVMLRSSLKIQTCDIMYTLISQTFSNNMTFPHHNYITKIKYVF